MPLRTILLDVDGTLLDTREFILQAFEHTARTHGVPNPGRDVLTPAIGRALDEIYASISDLPPDLLVETHRSFQRENLHLSTPFEGAGEVLDALRTAGYALAAVTNRSRRTSVLTLAQHGLAGFFGAIISAEDAPALKPDPAPLRAALERLGRGPEGAAMVGDSTVDVEAGRALGLATIGALYGFHGDQLREAEPDHLIEQLGELPDLIASL
jgi:HAD superfamily hydrolase (TIGR01549 family)